MGSSAAKTSSPQVCLGPMTFLGTGLLLPDSSSRICMGYNTSSVSPINAYPKSECMRFVHSSCSLVLFFSSDALDSGCDLRRLIEVGQLVQPRSVFM